MRRIVFSLACLLIGINAMAQLPIKITAKFAKGSQATYLFSSETTIGSPMGDSPIKSISSSEVKFSVTEVRPDGYTIEATMLPILHFIQPETQDILLKNILHFLLHCLNIHTYSIERISFSSALIS